MATQVLPLTIQDRRAMPSYWLVAYPVVLIALTAWIAMRVIVPATFPLDGAYVTLHSAQVMHSGADPNFVGVSPLFGATSAPFLFLVYSLLFIFPSATALSAACWLGAIVYALGLLRIGYAFRLRPGTTLGVLAAGLFTGFVPLHLFNGLETSWVLACVCWALVLSSEGRRNWAALAAGVAAALRPEFVIYAALFSAGLAWEERSARSFLKFLAISAAPVIPGAIWYLHVTGVPFPSTAEAKRYFFAEHNLPLASKFVELGGFFLVCGFSATGLALVKDSALAKINAIFLLLLVLASYAVPGGIYWGYFRYVTPAVPIMVWNLARTATSPSRLRYLLNFSVVSSILLLPIAVKNYRASCAEARDDLSGLAAWANSNLSPSDVIVAQDAGYLSYATNFRMVDIMGLKTPDAIDLNRTLTWTDPERSHAPMIAELAVRSHASYLVLRSNWFDMDAVPVRLRNQHWSVDLVKSSGQYRVYRLVPPREPTTD